MTTEQQNGLLERASKHVSNILGKPESYVMINLTADQTLFFAGSNKPTAYLELKSLGLPEAKTAEFSRALCEFINQETDISTDRIYIEFSSPDRHMWGFDGRTF